MKLDLGAATYTLLSAICLSGAVLVSSGRPAAHAAPITFAATFSGANEVPAVSPAGTGSATVILDPIAQTLQVNVLFAGLTSPSTAAHIHCCLLPGTAPTSKLPPHCLLFPASLLGNDLNVTPGAYISAVFRSHAVYNSTIPISSPPTEGRHSAG